jgi:hypothetical protein
LLQKWVTLVPHSLLKGNSRNYFASIATTVPVVSVKVNNFPDGGIARYRALHSLALTANHTASCTHCRVSCRVVVCGCRLQLFGAKTDEKVADMSNAEWTHLVAHEWIGKLQPTTGFPAHFQPPGTLLPVPAPPTQVSRPG